MQKFWAQIRNDVLFRFSRMAVTENFDPFMQI